MFASKDPTEELNQIRENLFVLSQQYEESFLSKIQSYSVQTEQDLLQTMADQVSHEEETIRSLIELSNVMAIKCQELLLTIQQQEGEISDMKMNHQIELSFQVQVAQQYQRLYQEQVDKNAQVIEQLYNTENKLDQQIISMQELQRSYKCLEHLRATSLDDMEQELKDKFLSTQDQLQNQLDFQADLLKSQRENMRQMQQQIQDLRAQLIQSESQKINSENQLRSTKSRQRTKFQSCQMNGSPQVLEVNDLSPVKRRLNNGDSLRQSALCKQLDHLEQLTDITANMSQNMAKQSQRLLSKISEESNPMMFHFNEQSEIVKQYSVLLEPVRDTQSSDSGTLVDIKESLQDIYKENNYDPDGNKLPYEMKCDQLKSQMPSQINSAWNLDRDKFDRGTLRNLDAKDHVVTTSSVGNLSQLIQNNQMMIQSLKSTYNQPNGNQFLRQNSNMDVIENTLRLRKHLQYQAFRSQNPYFDFFKLTTQCVKLNSKNFDQIITKDVSQLYTQLLAERVPFNKWYQNIKRKLEKTVL